MNRDNTTTLVFENHQSDARTAELKEGGVCPTLGSTQNASAANNNQLVVVIQP